MCGGWHFATVTSSAKASQHETAIISLTYSDQVLATVIIQSLISIVTLSSNIYSWYFITVL